MTDNDVRPATRRPRKRRSGVVLLAAGSVMALAAGLGPTTAAVADEGTGTSTTTPGSSSTSQRETPQSVQGSEPAPMVDPVQNATASEWVVLCTSFSPCKAAGYGNNGYDAVYRSSFWSQYGGHNCTNYVAYRMIRNGMSSNRPAALLGNALNWGVAMQSQTNDSPTVGSVAWWDRSFSASGHVAYVERVVSPSEIYVSEDNWGGDFRWRKVTRSGGRWPKGFIHLKDAVAPPSTPRPPATPPGYRPIATTRILDTRSGLGAPAGAVGAGREVSLAVGGRAGLPSSGVGAVMINVSVVSPSANGYTTAYPSGAARPPARNLSYSGGEWASSMYVSKVGADGRIRLFTSATAQLTVDVLGWYPTGTALTTINPTRILDTRTGLGVSRGKLRAQGRVDLLVGDGRTVPSSGVGAVVLGISTEGPTTGNWVTAWPAGTARPVTAHLHTDAGRAGTAVVITRVAGGGRVSIDTEASADLMVDVLGWLPAGSDYTSIPPARLLDTRSGLGGFAGSVPAGGAVSVQVAGRAGVPSSGVKSVAVTLTSLSPAAPGALTVYPSNWRRPGVGNVLYLGRRTTVNAAVLPVGPDGRVLVQSTAASQVVLDVQGWIRS